jgi:hypothetical protein
MTIQVRVSLQLILRAVLLISGLGGELLAAETAPKTPPAATPAPAVAVKFRPASKGAASVRVTGGSRGSGTEAVTLDVLAPDDIGTTTQEQPSLFWFQSKPSNAKFELTLLQENKAKPLVQVNIDQASKAGIQRLKLSDHGGKLAVGVEYQWVVALVNDAENRSKDLVASGVIKRVEPAADLKQAIASTPTASLAGVYAQAGVWYDALSVLSDEIEAHPENKELRQTRADLLRQVGLKTAAQADLAE